MEIRDMCGLLQGRLLRHRAGGARILKVPAVLAIVVTAMGCKVPLAKHQEDKQECFASGGTWFEVRPQEGATSCTYYNPTMEEL